MLGERRVPCWAVMKFAHVLFWQQPADVLFWRVLQVEQLEDPVAAAAEVVRRCEAPQLMALYKVGLQDHTID